MTYNELQEALKVLGLPERASLKEIRERHRILVKRHHPDSGALSAPEEIRNINAAYQCINSYLGSYRFSFTSAEFYEQNPHERLLQQFKTDPLWEKS